jgi:tetratricopeptide (TPR) repeat protein
VSHALIREFYEDLTVSADWDRFATRINERYSEATLVRLLTSADAKTRMAAVAALRVAGSINANAAVAERLRDEDPTVRSLAEQTLWTLWFRAESAESMEELRRLNKLVNDEQFAPALEALNDLIRRAPRFAEAYNQRAILFWRRGEYREAIADCKKVLHLNPYHFGALTGMGQCYLQLQRPAKALAAFREAYRINPNLDDVADSIEALEQLLNDE